VVVPVLSGSLIAGVHGLAPVAEASGLPSLMPDVGQFVAVPMYNALTTTAVASGQSISVPVTGAGGVPSGADAVVVKINTAQASTSGFFSAWDTDSGDSGTAAVAIVAGVSSDQTAVIPVSPAGTVSFTNHSAASASMQLRVTGYYTGAGTTAAGDTYFGVPWALIPGGQLAAGQSMTLQVGGQGGIAPGADVAVLQINAYNATQPGLLTVYTAGTADPGLAALEYSTIVEARNMFYVKPSASGQVTITNHGSGAATVNAYARGYFMPANVSPAGGEYTSIDPDVVYGSATAGTQLAANQSVTFQVADNGTSTDQGIIPSDVTQVAEDVIVTSPAADGTLQVGTPGGTTMHALINFKSNDNTDVGYDQSLLTQVSPSGQETITNTSGGTVKVQVAAVGFYEPPSAPHPPTQVAATVSGTSATVTWGAPDSDGGSPITGYTITAPPDTASVTVDGTTRTATLTGLSHAASDTFTVTATNAAGAGHVGTYTRQAAVVTGTVLQPSGAPLAGDMVSIYSADPPDPSLTSWTPVLIGTTTTDSGGHWSFTVPPYASLPSNAQVAANLDGGELNVEVVADGTVTTGGITYPETATAFQAAWVGTSTPAAAPDGVPTAQNMTLYPQGPDNSAQVTTTNVANTYASLNDSEITGSANYDTSTTVTDAYGFQEIGGNGTYNPFIAADGTNLTSLPVTSIITNPCSITDTQVGSKWDKWAIAAEGHTWWDVAGSVKYGRDGKTTVGGVVSLDFGADWAAGGSFTFTDSSGVGWSDTLPLGDHNAHRFKLHMWFKKMKQVKICPWGPTTKYYIREAGLDNPAGSGGPDKWSSYQITGEDGHDAFLASNPAYRNYIRRGVNRCITGVYSRHYQAGATLAGIGVFTETTYNTTTSQCIQAGYKRTRRHWEWGRGGQFTDRLARTLYSY